MKRRTGIGPFAEAGVIIFYLLFASTLITALAWAVSNVRLVPAQSRAVVLRLGALDRIQGPGLLLAWPAPVDQVSLVPTPEQLQEQSIQSLQRIPLAQKADQNNAVLGDLPDALAGSGYLLTGDASVVQLQVTVFYTVDDAYAYVLQREHIAPALERIVSAAAVAVCASRDLDAVLVARPELIAHDVAAAEQRERLHDDLAALVNRRLDDLKRNGGSLGIHIQRVDVQSSLPRATALAFTSVLTSTQSAAEEIAKARTVAENIRQSAERDAQARVKTALSNAAEQVATARIETANVLPLHGPLAVTDPGLPERDYRAALQTLLAKAGSVITIAPQDRSAFIFTGPGS
jgi:regulator of protease activity HflC (stomatin/prohibitin superfamily)